MSWMFPRSSGIHAPEPREWILGALYLPVFLFFLNFAILTYFPALGFPLTQPRNYFFANLLYMTVNFAVMLLIFRRTLWQSLREFEGKMLLSVLIGFGMCYGANLVLTTAYTVLDIMPENYNQEAVNSLLGGYPLAMTLCTVVLAPLAEECLFRGVLFAPLARRCLPAAYALSMFLFAGMHVFQFLGDPVSEPLSPGELLAVLGLSEDGQHLGRYFPAYVHQFPIRAREPSALADASVPVR